MTYPFEFFLDGFSLTNQLSNQLMSLMMTNMLVVLNMMRTISYSVVMIMLMLMLLLWLLLFILESLSLPIDCVAFKHVVFVSFDSLNPVINNPGNLSKRLSITRPKNFRQLPSGHSGKRYVVKASKKSKECFNS